MGLAEKKAVKEFETEHFPAEKKKLDSAAGFNVKLEVMWDEFPSDNLSPPYYNDALRKIYFTPVINAFKHIASDDMGKKALKDGLKKVIMRDSADNFAASNFTFEKGVLTIDFGSHINADDVSTREEAIKSLLDANL